MNQHDETQRDDAPGAPSEAIEEATSEEAATEEAVPEEAPSRGASARPTPPPDGLRHFLLMWSGQVISLIGSGLTSFAIGVWVYQETGNVTLFTLIAASSALPAVLLSPIAGVLVDRFDRKWMLVLSDTGAAVSSLSLLVLFATDALELWHIYVLVGLNAAFNTLQFPAFSAANTLLIPKKHFGRASGMMQFGFSGAQVLAPLIAGALIAKISIPSIIAIDLATFAVAVILLLFVKIPAVTSPGKRPAFWSQALYGWRYITDRPGLVGLLLFFSFVNLVVPMTMVLTTPMVLSFTNAADLGMVLSLGSAGMVVGSLVMTAWGGPKRRMMGILGAAPVISLGMVLAGVQAFVPLIAAGLFVIYFTLPVLNASSQAIWQSKVEPSVQGRVFATRRMMAQITAPVAYFAAGPLAERVFVPLLESGGALAGGAVGAALGVGPGRGLGLMMICLGAVFATCTLLALAWPRMRRLEDVIPDAVGDAPA